MPGRRAPGDLDGAGGVGKTRLAVDVAEDSRRFPAGVYSWTRPRSEIESLWRASPWRWTARRERTARLRAKTLQQALQTKRSDPDGQLRTPDAEGPDAAALHEDSPRPRILATSRKPLRSPGRARSGAFSLTVQQESASGLRETTAAEKGNDSSALDIRSPMAHDRTPNRSCSTRRRVGARC